MSHSLLRRVADIPVLGRMMLLPYRAALVIRALLPGAWAGISWLARSRETTNFTYDLTPGNLGHLAAFVANVTGCSLADAESYIHEALTDDALRRHVRDTPVGGRSDREPCFGRRLGWYAIVRASKPRLIVETGVDKGLGSVMLCAALLKNESEGRSGAYIGTDINPFAGRYLHGCYAAVGRVVYGDSIETLRILTEPVDVFINDSDHSADYEAAEYAEIEDHLAVNAIVLGDNAHVTDRLLRFAKATGRSFLYFKEEPVNHWYSGGGIGAAFLPQTSTAKR